MFQRPTVSTALVALFALAAARSAATIDKTNNADNLNLGSSWVGGVAPGAADVARWSASVPGPNTVSLGADTNWLGIKVTNPGGAATVNAGNTLGLGGSGIDMSAATTNLTLNCGLTLLADQTWNLSSTSALTIGGTVGGGSVALAKAGSGTAALSGLNSLSGSVAVNAGRLSLNNQRALGFASATVADGAQVYIGAATTYTNALTLTGNGADNQGALRFNGGTAGWSGPITLAGGARIGGYAASGAYTLSGGIGGTGDLRFWAGGASYTHVHTFTISAPCAYTGDTVLDTYAACPVVVLSGGANRLPVNGVLTMLAGVWNGQVLSATLKLNGNSQAFAGLMSGNGTFGSGGTNRVANGSATAATLTINADSDKFFDGTLGGPGANENNLALTKNGAGKLTINDRCGHTGATQVNGGILNFLGGLNGGAVTVANSATLLLGNGTSIMTGLTLLPTAALGVNLGAPSNPYNTVLQVNGNLVLGGTMIVQDLGDAAVSNVVTVINYTGTLLNLGMTTDPRSLWNVQVDSSTAGKVNLLLLSKQPAISFTTANTTVSNSLQFDMQGVLRGFPNTPVWYEVHTPDGQMWDFGAMPPTPNWTIHLRHLRLGTNNVRAFTLGAGGIVQEDTRQVVLQLGANPPVRPRPCPAEIWWGGVATDLAPDYGFAQLVDPARPWDFVRQYEDGIFLHGIMSTSGTMAKLGALVAPALGRFGREDSYYTQADPNFGLNDAASFNTDLLSLAGDGVYVSFHSVDYTAGLKTGSSTNPGWCQKWPDWTHAQMVSSNMQCWADFVSSLHTNWPGLKLGMTWSPVWFNWNGHPALVPSGDALTLHPVKDLNGTVITNQYGTNAWFDFDMQELFDKASATAQAGDGYYGFASDCPYDYFATWSNYTDRTNNQAKILGYEAWEHTNGYFTTTICNYSAASGSDTNAWDASYMKNSFAYITAKQQMGGRTQKYLFEAWYSGPYSWAPESDTNSFSGMVKQAIKYLKGVSDTNGTLEPLTLTATAGSGAFRQVQLQNNGDIQCLPALVAWPGGVAGVTTRYFTTNGSELTASLQTAEGLCFTNLLQPGGATNLVAATTAAGLAASTNESASLEAYWNPQDPLGIVRDREWLSPTLDPLGSWQSLDIGSGGLAGGVGLSSNVFSVIGSGADIWGAADTFHFVYLPAVTGDGTITARVSAQLNSDPWAKAGVMVREALAAGSRYAFLAITPGNGVSFQSRGTADGASVSATQAGVAAPCWVRLVRAGTTLTGYYSSNGADWTQLGSTNLAGLASSVSFGLAVCSHNTSRASVATLDSVSVAGAGSNHAPAFTPIPNRTIVAGYTLQVPVASYVTDTDSPPQALSFSLLTAPTNATLNSTTGVFTWRPLLAQAPLVTSVRLAATDNGSPPLSATQSFWMTVNSPAQPRFGAPGFGNGLFTLTVEGDAGPDYTVFGSTNLVDWDGLWTNYSAAPPFEFTDPAATNLSLRFYRVRLGP